MIHPCGFLKNNKNNSNNKKQQQLVLVSWAYRWYIMTLDPPWRYFRLPAMAGRVLWVRSSLLSIVFFETLLRGRGLYRDERDRPIFCEKFPLGKNNKVVKNCRKEDFLEFLRKLSHLFCLEMMKNKIMMVLWHS